MSPQLEQEPFADLRPLIDLLGVQRVIDQIGLLQVIEQVGLQKVIENVAPDRLVAELLARMTPEQLEQLKQRLP